MKEILIGTLVLYLVTSFLAFDFTYVLHMGEWHVLARCCYLVIWMVFVSGVSDVDRRSYMD